MLDFLQAFNGVLRSDKTGKTFQENVDCQACPEGLNTNIRIPRDVWNDIKEIRNRFLPNEMAIFLMMDKTEYGYLIKDYTIPRQNVGRANVEINEMGPSDRDGHIGHLHSHGTFSAFFSYVDRSHFNYDVQMVIGSKSSSAFMSNQSVDDLSVVSVVRTKTSCGRIMQKDGNLTIIEPPTLPAPPVVIPIVKIRRWR